MQPLKIFCDFDGTITRLDTLNILLDRFADPSWRSIEDRVTRHELNEEEALRQEFALVRNPYEEVRAYLMEQVQIDHGFADFASWCKRKDIPLVIVSGGFESIIKDTLDKFSINLELEIYANSVDPDPAGWKIIPPRLPRINKLCNHCKTNHVVRAAESGYRTVYIGDGNTDRCPAVKASIIFAKGSLAEYLLTQNIEFYSFENFTQVRDRIQTEIDP